MSLLAELKTIIESCGVNVETGVFSSPPPDRYAVLTPLLDRYELFSDNIPTQDIEEVRISLFDKGNYITIKNQIEKAILYAGLTVTDRIYISRDNDTGHFHYVIDTAKNYIL